MTCRKLIMCLIPWAGCPFYGRRDARRYEGFLTSTAAKLSARSNIPRHFSEKV